MRPCSRTTIPSQSDILYTLLRDAGNGLTGLANAHTDFGRFKNQNLLHQMTFYKFLSDMDFDKNISDWSHDCTDHKDDFKRPKKTVKKSQIF